MWKSGKLNIDNSPQVLEGKKSNDTSKIEIYRHPLNVFDKYSTDFIFPYDMLSHWSSFNKQWSESSIDFMGLSSYLKFTFVAFDRFIKKPHAFDLATKSSTLDSKYEFLHNNIKLLNFYNYVNLLTHR